MFVGAQLASWNFFFIILMDAFFSFLSTAPTCASLLAAQPMAPCKESGEIAFFLWKILYPNIRKSDCCQMAGN